MAAVNSTALVLLVVATAAAEAPPLRVRSPTGTMHVLALHVGFPDRPVTKPREALIGRPDALLDRLAAYYREASHGKLVIEPALAEAVVTLPAPRASYVQRPNAMAAAALDAFDAVAGEADRALLARAQALFVIFAGPGQESHVGSGDPGDPWSNYVNLVPVNLGFADAVVLAEEEVPPFSNFGVACHEFGHLLGLPELYAPGGRTQEGIGKWGIMGQGTWVGKGDRPTGLDAWSKMLLGWVDVEVVDRTTPRVELPAVLEVPRIVRIPAASGRPEEYYLLENRRREGIDAELPGEGILVWHVDERRRSFRLGMADVHHKMIHLVEADGRGDLDRGTAAGGNRGDAGDPWVGPPRWHRAVGGALALAGALLLASAVFRAARPGFALPVALRTGMAAALLAGAFVLGRPGPVCGPATPGMAPYGSSRGRVVLDGFSPAGRVMHVDVVVAPGEGGG